MEVVKLIQPFKGLSEQQRLDARLYSLRNNAPKVFIMDIFVKFEDFIPLQIFKEMNIDWDIFCLRFFHTFYKLNETDFLSRSMQIIEFLQASIKVHHIDVDPLELNYQLSKVFKDVRAELVGREFYKDGTLIFNNLNLETPNSLIFFRMERSDV